MLIRKLPNRTWQIVVADMFDHDRKQYLVLIDYYSDYFEIENLTATTSTAIINLLRAQFSRHGIPETLFSDNGPQFASSEFQKFVEKWKFEHITSSPYYSQSNGKAESVVNIAKRILTVAKETGEDPYLILLEQRNIPSANIDYSPVQRMFSRRTRTLLPTVTEVLLPRTPEQHQIVEKLQKRRLNHKRVYDRGARDLPELEKGQKVWVQCVPDNPRKWIKGEVLANRGYRSYDVIIEGTVRRRNRIHLRKRMESDVDDHEQETDKSGQTRSGIVYQKREDVGEYTIGSNVARCRRVCPETRTANHQTNINRILGSFASARQPITQQPITRRITTTIDNNDWESGGPIQQASAERMHTNKA
jgi:hypothetical protein